MKFNKETHTQGWAEIPVYSCTVAQLQQYIDQLHALAREQGAIGDLDDMEIHFDYDDGICLEFVRPLNEKELEAIRVQKERNRIAKLNAQQREAERLQREQDRKWEKFRQLAEELGVTVE